MKAARAFAASRIQSQPELLPMSPQCAPPVMTPPCAVGSPLRAAILARDEHRGFARRDDVARSVTECGIASPRRGFSADDHALLAGAHQ